MNSFCRINRLLYYANHKILPVPLFTTVREKEAGRGFRQDELLTRLKNVIWRKSADYRCVVYRR